MATFWAILWKNGLLFGPASGRTSCIYSCNDNYASTASSIRQPIAKDKESVVCEGNEVNNYQGLNSCWKAMLHLNPSRVSRLDSRGRGWVRRGRESIPLSWPPFPSTGTNTLKLFWFCDTERDKEATTWDHYFKINFVLIQLPLSYGKFLMHNFGHKMSLHLQISTFQIKMT